MATAKRKKAPKAKTEAATTPVKTETPKAMAPKPAKEPRVSVTAEIKKLVYADPTLNAAAIAAKLAERGITTTAGSVQTVKTDFSHSLRVLADLGAIKQA